MVLTLYYDMVSQPSRAIYMFLKFAKVDFNEQIIDPLSPKKPADFLKKNPIGTVPVIDDGGFVLTESVAIMRYLAVQYKMPDHLYPRDDAKKMARVDEFLNWQHTGLRKPCVQVFLNIFISNMKKQPFDVNVDKEGRASVTKAVNHIADYFLKGQDGKDRLFISGDNISAADILGVSELFQLEGIKEEGLYTSNKKVNDWVERVKARLQPHFDTSAKKILGLRKDFMASKK